MGPHGHSYRLRELPGRYMVCRLGPDEPWPDWAKGRLMSMTRCQGELSVVCEQGAAPDGVPVHDGLAALMVRGPLAFSLTGVLASLSAALAGAGVPLLALSTYDTDYLLVPAERLSDARRALAAAGHVLEPAGGQGA